MEDNQLRIQELTWELSKDRKILDDISMTFLEGGFYGILGPNGSGKTSLIRHILRLIETKKGQLLLNNQELKVLSRKELAKCMALVPQNTNIDTAFTAYDIAMMGRAPYQKRFQDYTQNDRDIVEEAMKMTNCYHLKDSLFANLSGGEAQRVVTARAIAQQTPWLILDEPISHLDIRYQIELMEHLMHLNEERGISILAVLHDINLAANYCKQIVLMKDAKIIAHGKTEDVLTKENLELTFDMKFLEIKQENLNRKLFIAELPTNQ